jgi:type IV pilus assembly protein PilP
MLIRSKRIKRRKNKVHYTLTVFLQAAIQVAVAGLLCLAAPCTQLFAEEKPPITAESLLQELMSDDDFVYGREGRTDPFVPFLTDKAKVDQSVIPEAREELVGMRKFEPGQLSLVAIVLGGRENLAMVQDPAGQGYVIRKGTKIGRFGVVDDIAPNRVIVQNITFTRTGDKRLNRVEMLLKKRGDEK